MLLSMTGFGTGQAESARASVSVEMRSVNNRHFKLSYRGPDVLGPYESDMEKLVRDAISRGTIQLSVRVSRPTAAAAELVDRAVLEGYWKQLSSLAKEFGAAPPLLTDLLALPGVLQEGHWAEDDAPQVWQLAQQALRQSLAAFHEFRQREGAAMAADIQTNISMMRERLQQVLVESPRVVTEYRDKLLERVNELLAEAKVTLEPAAVIREVSMFADRCDIREELARLTSHLDQFDRFVREEAAPGRRLEFLSQEMLREVNTTGSKANNVAIAHAVVDMKTAVERLREMLANVE